MNNNLDIKLYLPQHEGLSLLRAQIFEEELSEINRNFPLDKNKVDITSTYITEHEDSVEVGFFIRNTLTTYVAFERVALCLKDEEGGVLTSQVFNFKDMTKVPPSSGVPMSINFKKNESFNFDKNKKYIISFDNADKMESYEGAGSEIENMPTNLSFESEREILDYANGLETLKANEISLSVFKLAQSQDRGIDITLLMRNGYDRNIKLQVLPVKVLNYNDTVIGKDIFRNPEGLVSISAKKSKLLRLHLDPSKLYTTIFDLSKCKVVFEE
ncbi:SLAP domain-containing protein [Clostridium punense]|uniref:SLAP domain-containing protein n=1 Tax=Clostridium punense TaxID=1054297 RepID=A0ABS4K206_9CLOT|nr:MULTISPECIES: SLAP domain-containing protein [Clostridium]EQB88390.1 hypothetical protein M918_04410 [Clostridium sp. BL8]MBP2021166.1 SLAP domain-containing protein [Clostridium punense]